MVRSWVAAATVAAFALGACSDDDSPTPADADAAQDQASDDPGSDDGIGDLAGSVSDDLLLVPRAYLQGEWCDSDGNTWSIDGDIVRGGEGGGSAELPIDLVFINTPDRTLVAQTDDEFVVADRGDETTFTRGGC